MRTIAALILALLVLSIPPSVRAQAPAPEVISGPAEISAELRAQLETYLAASPPSVASFYAPTYAQDEGQYTLVSLAGLNIESADEPWYIEGRGDAPANVIWIGTVRINADGSGSLHSAQRQARNLPKLAAPLIDLLPGAGGGSYVRLPYSTGRAMLYGVRGIHGAGDYGTSGMRAVDLVGGTGLGNNVASSTLLASGAGTVDYVCADDNSVAIRTYNSATDDYWLYAHVLDNASLEMDHVFAAGAVIGTLRSGAFDDDCGWAEQDDTIYHVHWMFEPASGAYRVGAYTILESDGKFHAGNNVYATGSWISNTGSPGNGVDDPPAGTTGTVPSFWDTVIGGMVSAASGAASVLPPPTAGITTVIHTARNSVSLFFRLTWILLRGNLNFAWTAIALGIVIAVRLLVAVPWTAMLIVRILRVLKQTFSPLG
jgi:hypothetical protein